MTKDELIADLSAEFNKFFPSNLAADQSADREPLPPHVVTPRMVAARLEAALARAAGRSPSPVEVRCNLSEKVGHVEVAYYNRETGEELRTLEKVEAVLNGVLLLRPIITQIG